MPIGNGSLSSLAQIVDEAKLEGARRLVRAVAPPKAKVRGSNPLGRASKINNLTEFPTGKILHSYHIATTKALFHRPYR